ncbi:MAG: DNA photolyase [Acidobacteria bacterium]|nr:MAG: DNA photolyase [Acidobacteriota bacterium]
MITTVYVEEEVREHPRVRAICRRLPKAVRIACRRYGEIFNRRGQSFRLQKRQPALILAAKRRPRVLETPAGYGVGGERNYYFSHLLNCPYDCRYCFLQGMYRSAHYVLFVNYEDFFDEVAEIAGAAAGESWFFSGYDCDSLALEPLTGFAAAALDRFRRLPAARLELRTKSVQLAPLRARPPLANVVVAFSLTPEGIWRDLEHGVPGVERRLAAMAELARRGWRLGLRFDPLIYRRDFAARYDELFARVFAALPLASIHSVSLGPFRLPRPFFKNLLRHYPDEPLLAGPLAEHDGMISYRHELEREMVGAVTASLLRHVPRERFFPCAA